jgi:hypothetical protein
MIEYSGLLYDSLFASFRWSNTHSAEVTTLALSLVFCSGYLFGYFVHA